MDFLSMLIDGGRCLRAAVALGVIEIKRDNSMIAENALECDATVARLSGVIAHTSL
jgi:hypothetical protein